MVLAELTISNARTCQVCAYYRPHPDDDISLEPLSQSLSKINPISKSVIIVGGECNIGYMDWETLSVFQGKPNQKQHQQFLDIINDNSLTQVVNKTTRKDKTLDLIVTNYPATVNKVETLPPIADHDIVYIEFITSLRRCQPKQRKIFKYSKANWENINKDLGNLEKEIKDKYSDSDVNTIWNLLKNEIHRSVTENIPQKILKHRQNLPWITNEIKTKMSKYKKKYKKHKLSGKCKDSKLKQMKANIQKEQRTAYWQYIEKIICNIPVDDNKTPTSSKFPKNLFSYLESNI